MEITYITINGSPEELEELEALREYNQETSSHYITIEALKKWQKVLKQETSDNPASWIWDHWVPATGLTVLGSGAGEGKTALAMYIAAHVKSGTWGPIKKVLWITPEDSAFVHRIQRMGYDLSNLKIINPMYLKGPFVAGLKDHIGDAQFIVIDNIDAVLDTLVDYTKGQRRYDVFKIGYHSIIEPLLLTKIPILITEDVHINLKDFKDNGDHSALTHMASSIIHLSKDPVSTFCTMESIKNRNWAPDTSCFTIDSKTGVVDFHERK